MGNQSENAAHEFDGLTAKQVRVAQMVFDGVPQGEISEEVGVHTSTIYRWSKSDKFQEFMQVLSDDAQRATRRYLASRQMKAAKTADKCLDSHDHTVALRAAFGVLDRTGHPKTERQEIKQTVSATVDMGATEVVASLDSAMEGL